MSESKKATALVCICNKELIVFKSERFDDDRDKMVCNNCGTVYLPRYCGATDKPVMRRVGEDSYKDFEGEIIYD